VVAVAPQAARQTWYPYSFTAPIELNEPDLSAALAALAGLLATLDAGGVPASRTVIAGFSQGACLGLEFVARNARRYGGVAGLSGGLIGPSSGSGTPRSYLGSLEGTPVLLSCGTNDPHIPRERVEETAEVLRGLGGVVTLRLDPLLGHTIDDEEIDAVRGMLEALIHE
jgi:predicted esterase